MHDLPRLPDPRRVIDDVEDIIHADGLNNASRTVIRVIERIQRFHDDERYATWCWEHFRQTGRRETPGEAAKRELDPMKNGGA